MGWAYESIVERELQRLSEMAQQLPRLRRAKVQARLTQALFESPYHIETSRGPVDLVLFGLHSAKRANALLTKQPATIAWIESFRPRSVFWDVGANVGVYTVYAALRDDIQVLAFEPAAVNYFLLTANCELNRLDERVECFLAGLGDQRHFGHLHVSQFEPGGSFSFLGKPTRPRGGRQSALIVPIDELVEEYGLACPNYMKIDVPGLTDAIVRGGARTLQRPDFRELHVEAREDADDDRLLIELLARYGLTITGRHANGDGNLSDLTFAKTVGNG